MWDCLVYRSLPFCLPHWVSRLPVVLSPEPGTMDSKAWNWRKTRRSSQTEMKGNMSCMPTFQISNVCVQEGKKWTNWDYHVSTKQMNAVLLFALRYDSVKTQTRPHNCSFYTHWGRCVCLRQHSNCLLYCLKKKFLNCTTAVYIKLQCRRTFSAALNQMNLISKFECCHLDPGFGVANEWSTGLRSK